MAFWDVLANTLVQVAGSRAGRPKEQRPWLSFDGFMRYHQLGSYSPNAAAAAPSITEGGSYMPGMIVPPGGAAGFAQMTPASRLALAGGRTARRRKKRRAKKSAAPRRRKARKARKLVKGSAAARRHMAKLRAKRK